MLPQKTEGLAVQCRFAARTHLKISDCPFFEVTSTSRTRCGESSVVAATWALEIAGQLLERDSGWYDIVATYR